MGNAIYCETKESSVPYVFDNTQVTVYSYEEVCFYIFQNASMITREQLGPEFLEWLQNDLEMSELAEKLREIRQSGKEWNLYLKTLFEGANYYEKEEVQLLFERMKEEETMPIAFRLKRQADNFVRFHKYLKAVRLYDEILKREDVSKELVSKIMHNKGVAYAKSRNFTEARRCYLRAYETDKNELSLSCYLVTFFLENREAEAKKQCEKLNVGEEIYERIYGDYIRSIDSYHESAEYQEVKKIEIEQKNQENDKADRRMKRLLNACKDEFCIQNR